MLSRRALKDCVLVFFPGEASELRERNVELETRVQELERSMQQLTDKLNVAADSDIQAEAFGLQKLANSYSRESRGSRLLSHDSFLQHRGSLQPVAGNYSWNSQSGYFGHTRPVHFGSAGDILSVARGSLSATTADFAVANADGTSPVDDQSVHSHELSDESAQNANASLPPETDEIIKSLPPEIAHQLLKRGGSITIMEHTQELSEIQEQSDDQLQEKEVLVAEDGPHALEYQSASLRD